MCSKCDKEGIVLREYGGAKAVFSQMADCVEIKQDSKNYPILRIKSALPTHGCVRNAYRKLANKPEEWVPVKSLIKELKWGSSDKLLLETYGDFLQYNSGRVRVHNISKYENIKNGNIKRIITFVQS